MGKCQPDFVWLDFFFSSRVILSFVFLYQAAVEELEHSSEEDVGEISVNDLQLPKIVLVLKNF